MTNRLVPIERIRSARDRAAGVVRTTPLDPSATLTRLCGRPVHLKLENLQKTGSFKVRGALNRIQLLDAGARARGVITASAGNHAQGVAYAARMAGVSATVVIPETAAFSKIAATRDYGAEVILAGQDYQEAAARAHELAGQRGATFVHAFDDAEVIAGQGTLGLEVLEQLPDLDAILVPVGGGGLLAGVVSALRGSGCGARIVGVQPAGASALAPSLRSGRRVTLDTVDTIADGLATGALGEVPFEIVRDAVDEVIEVGDAEIAAAVVFLLERAKTVAEGAGAVGVAACLAGRLPAQASRVVVVVSGGNIDMNLLDRILTLGLVQERRLARLRIRLLDRPGELQRLTACVARCRANIHQVRHERSLPGLPLTQALLTLDLETHGPGHIEEIRRALHEAGFAIEAEVGLEGSSS